MLVQVRWPRRRGELIFGGCMWAVAAACAVALTVEFMTITS